MEDQRNVADKLIKIRNVVVIGGLWIIGLLVIISLFIIVNTIKLTMFVRRLDINIMKSVGATNGFIRVPFIIEGMAIGFISGILSFGVLWYAYFTITKFVSETLSTSPVAFSDVALLMMGSFIGAGILIGAIGSFISIAKFLRDEGGNLIG